MLNRPARQRGFTLIEVLVTIFVLAIGLLAAAAMQARSKVAAFDALQRTTASIVAQDILERMRANPGALASYVNAGISSAPPVVECNDSKQCSATELAAHDLSRWWQSMNGSNETTGDSSTPAGAGGLVAPTGCISQIGTACHYRVVIAWRGLTPIDQTADRDIPNDPLGNTCGNVLGDYRRLLVQDAQIFDPNASPALVCQ